MSVHIMRKGVDKRFVDAVVVTQPYCPPGEYDYGHDNKIYIKKNTDRLHPSQQVINSRYIIYSTAHWHIENTENWLGEYLVSIINLASQQGYRTLAVPSDICEEMPVSLAEIHHVLSAWSPENMRVYIMVDENRSYIPQHKADLLKSLIDSRYQPEQTDKTKNFYETEAKSTLGINNWFDAANPIELLDDDYLNDVISILKRNSDREERHKIAQQVNLDEYVSIKEEGFSQTLLAMIEQKGMDPVVCYKRANINRRTFSKIRTDKSYHPSKRTVFAFAISLKLTYEETEYLLKSAGYTFTNSSKMDIIVEYHILNGIYDIFEINNALYEFDQPLLGL